MSNPFFMVKPGEREKAAARLEAKAAAMLPALRAAAIGQKLTVRTGKRTGVTAWVGTITDVRFGKVRQLNRAAEGLWEVDMLCGGVSRTVLLRRLPNFPL